MAETLYTRLGGYDGIAMFATKLVGQAQEDENLGRFWANRGEDRIARELGVGPTEGGEVMEFLNSLKDDIVTA
jgi:hypothetical protein